MAKSPNDSVKKIDNAIEQSVKPRPATITYIVEETGEHRTKVWRRMIRRWVWRGGGWERREKDDER